MLVLLLQHPEVPGALYLCHLFNRVHNSMRELGSGTDQHSCVLRDSSPHCLKIEREKMLIFHLSSATLPKEIESENMQHPTLKTNTQKPTESKAISYNHQQSQLSHLTHPPGNTRTLLFTLICNLGLFLKHINYLILNESHRDKGMICIQLFQTKLHLQ